MKKKQLQEYTYVKNQIDQDLDPYATVQLLYNRVLDKLEIVSIAMEKQDLVTKGENIGAIITIFDVLISVLDMEKGGEVAVNLANLYSYIVNTLITANLNNSIENIQEIINLVQIIKSGWDGIAGEAKKLVASSNKRKED